MWSKCDFTRSANVDCSTYLRSSSREGCSAHIWITIASFDPAFDGNYGSHACVQRYPSIIDTPLFQHYTPSNLAGSNPITKLPQLALTPLTPPRSAISSSSLQPIRQPYLPKHAQFDKQNASQTQQRKNGIWTTCFLRGVLGKGSQCWKSEVDVCAVLDARVVRQGFNETE